MMLSVLFVCVHNAGRSQMAEAFLRHLSKERGLAVSAASAGTMGAGSLNPVAVEVMKEVGIDMSGHEPKLLTPELVKNANVVVSMGCGVDAEACPTKFMVTEDWGLDDPAGRGIEVVRRIRDEIKLKVDQLLEQHPPAES